MKYQITKVQFEALGEDTQKEYTLDGDKAILKIEGEGAPTAEVLTRAEDKLRIEKEHRHNAEKARDDAEKREEKLKKDLEGASGKEEIAKIREDHQKELDKIRDDRAKEQQATKDARNVGLKKETSEAFANDHFTIPGLMVDQFAKRLSIEEVDGTPVVRVLGADGKASALSLDELKKEFLDNKDYSTIIKANAGSGGGADNSGGGGGASQKKIAEMTAREEADFERGNPDGYKAALTSEGLVQA